MTPSKPFAESSVQNRQPIQEILDTLLSDKKTVLEIGSGTGQHAVYFAEAYPHLTWQSSDRSENIAGIKMWLNDAELSNTPDPLELDVSSSSWPTELFDVVYSANTVHIMHWPQVIDCFAGMGSVLDKHGLFILYGPFNYDGQYTSESNQRFDQWLKADDPGKGIRDIEALNQLAKTADMTLIHDFPMPANNRILVWKKS